MHTTLSDTSRGRYVQRDIDIGMVYLDLMVHASDPRYITETVRAAVIRKKSRTPLISICYSLMVQELEKDLVREIMVPLLMKKP